MPDDCEDCSVFFQAVVGPKGEVGSEVFEFTVATPASVANMDLPRWGHGLFLVSEFSWRQVDRALERLLAQSQRETWLEVTVALRRCLHWEFESYQSGP